MRFRGYYAIACYGSVLAKSEKQLGDQLRQLGRLLLAMEARDTDENRFERPS